MRDWSRGSSDREWVNRDRHEGRSDTEFHGSTSEMVCPYKKGFIGVRRNKVSPHGLEWCLFRRKRKDRFCRGNMRCLNDTGQN